MKNIPSPALPFEGEGVKIINIMNTIIPYDRHLKERARELRKNQTPAELEVWESIRKKKLGVEFHRQVPLLHYNGLLLS